MITLVLGNTLGTEFLDVAFGYVNLNWHYIEFDERYLRPSEVELLMDPTKSRQKLGWSQSVTFEQLVALNGGSRLASPRSH